MNLKKDKGVKVLAYTAVVFGAFCLTRAPVTNSKYIKASELNNEYFEYKTGLKQLSYVSDNNDKIINTSFRHDETSDGHKATITFEVPRNSIDTENDTTYTYYFDTKDKGCTINGQNPQIFTGYNPEPIQVSMTCNAQVETTTDSFMSIEAELVNQVTADAYVEVYENVNEEDRFLYRIYEGKQQGSKTDFQADKTVTLTSSTKFTEFIQWLIRYMNYNSDIANNITEVKSYIRDEIIKEFETKYGSYNETNLSNYIKDYNNYGMIPKIIGINSLGNNKYEIDENLLGYAKTYNANKNLSSTSNRYTFFFSTKEEQDVESIFEEYSKTYFGENADKINEYVKERRGVYNVLYGNGKIGGMSKQENVPGQLNINNLSTLILMANLEPNTYNVRSNVKTTPTLISSQLNRDFEAIRGIMEDEDKSKMKSIILNSVGDYDANTNKYYIDSYLARGYYDELEYENVRRYFIYRSTYDLNKFILVKLEPDGEESTAENPNYNMNIYFSYLDEAILAGQEGIFNFDKDKDEIYINIDTPFPAGRDEDYNDVKEIIGMLNNYTGINYPENPEKNIIKPRYADYYYYNYKYEVMENTNQVINKSVQKAPASMDATGEVKAADENLKDASENVPLKTDSNEVNEKVTSTKDVLNKIDDSNVSDKQVSETDSSIDKNKLETVDESKDMNNKITSEGNPESSEMKETNEIKDVEDSTPYTISDDVR